MSEYPFQWPDEAQQRMLASISTSLARQFHPDCSRDDIYQELVLAWHDKWRYIQHYVYDEDEARGAAKLRRTMTNAGMVYAQAEKAMRRGYHVDDIYHYSTGALKLLLPHLWDTESVSSYAARGEKVGRSMKPANEGGDFMAMKLDVELAWRRITQEQRDLLYDCWVEPVGESDALSYGLLAADEGCEPEAMRKRAERALTALQRQLGGPRPVERRKAVSNAAAQSQTRNDYGSE